ncbi:unnamed protein product [Amaranthus hypochondriacus]
MGRRGRPPKVQVVPRKPVSCSSRESSSSPDRYVFHSSKDVAAVSTPDTSIFGDVAANRVGLSWVSILKRPTPPSPGGGPPPVSISGEVQSIPPVTIPLKPQSPSCPKSSRQIACISKDDVVNEVDDEGFKPLRQRFRKVASPAVGDGDEQQGKVASSPASKNSRL